jgi:hypothetical protein
MMLSNVAIVDAIQDKKIKIEPLESLDPALPPFNTISWARMEKSSR